MCTNDDSAASSVSVSGSVWNAIILHMRLPSRYEDETKTASENVEELVSGEEDEDEDN